MDRPEYVISALEDHSSRLNKEAIIEAQAQAGNFEFFEGVRMALSPYVTFGIKKVPEKTEDSGEGLTWEAFALICTGFCSRNITGNAARDTVKNMMAKATKKQWNNWYRRILIKDLRCGVSEKTVNKVVKKFKNIQGVPVFACQLAHGVDEHPKKVVGPKLVEVKLDGVRVITIVYPEGRVDQYSRNGKELVNFEHVKDQFKKTAHCLSEPMVFDGEVMSSSFQDLMKQVHRKSNVKANDAVLHLFDMLPLEDFERGVCKAKQIDRSYTLNAWYNDNSKDLANVQILSQELVDFDTEEGQAKFSDINRRALEGGYEGIMIKDPNAKYECKRSASWLKQKPVIEVSLNIVAVEEGTGRNLGRLGAFVCEGNDSGKHIRVNVGSGYSDSQRDTFWEGRDTLLGQVVEVRADVISQNQDGSYSLRFPRFVRFRGFEVGEKM